MDNDNFSGSYNPDDDNEHELEYNLFDDNSDFEHNPYISENTRLGFKDGILYSRKFSDLEARSVLTLPDDVRGIAQGAFYLSSFLSEIILSEGLEFIEMGAFSNCGALEKITIPKNVIQIGRNPFEECPKLQSIEVDPDNPNYCSVNGCLYDKEMTTLIAVPGASVRLEIPSGVSVIAPRAAFCCAFLAEAVIPDSVTRIDDESFWGTGCLRTIQLPLSLAYIGENAFRASALEELVIPGGVTEIGESAFCSCRKLVSAVISEGVKGIAIKMFEFCDFLTKVELPQSLETIGSGAFDYCELLSDLEIPNSVKSIGMAAFSRTEFYEKLSCDFVILGDGILYQYRGDESEIVIPDGVKYLGAAFASNRSIKSVIIPEGVVRIDDKAFELCDFVSNFVLPKSLRSIGRNAFRECYWRGEICLNEGLEEIEDCAFAECDFKKIALPDTLKRIGTGAFWSCELSSVTIPQGVESIGDEAFSENSHLEFVKIPASVSDIGINPFENCSPSLKIEIDEANPFFHVYGDCVYTADGGRLLFAPPAVERVEVLSCCTEIERFAFCDNKAIRRVVIPDSVTQIGQYAFADCELFSTSLTIDSWDSKYGCSREEYALNFMRLYEVGDPFFEKNCEANNAFIRAHCYELLRAIRLEDTDVIRYMANEGMLDVYAVDLCLQMYEEDIEMSAVLLDYRNSRFSREYLDACEEDEFRKEIGEAERTPEEWRKFFSFEETRDGYSITGYYGTKKDVAVPGAIGTTTVKCIARSAFSPKPDNCELGDFARKARNNIRSVVIMEGVLVIRAYAFFGCAGLTEVVLPDGLFAIEESAFEECHRLTEITIPDSVSDISPYAFDDNITIKGTKRSYGIAFARHYGYKYEII